MQSGPSGPPRYFRHIFGHPAHLKVRPTAALTGGGGLLHSLFSFPLAEQQQGG
jgi:hypothetical protein